jgi:hypothetical protein
MDPYLPAQRYANSMMIFPSDVILILNSVCFCFLLVERSMTTTRISTRYISCLIQTSNSSKIRTQIRLIFECTSEMPRCCDNSELFSTRIDLSHHRFPQITDFAVLMKSLSPLSGRTKIRTLSCVSYLRWSEEICSAVD